MVEKRPLQGELCTARWKGGATPCQIEAEQDGNSTVQTNIFGNFWICPKVVWWSLV